MGPQMPYFLIIGGKMITIQITNIIAATMLMFMIGCEKEAEDSAIEEPAEEEQEEETVRYH